MHHKIIGKLYHDFTDYLNFFRHGTWAHFINAGDVEVCLNFTEMLEEDADLKINNQLSIRMIIIGPESALCTGFQSQNE